MIDFKQNGLPTIGCIDLGAGKPIGQNKWRGVVDSVVIMSDRRPDFLVEYGVYNPLSQTRLNKHGPLNHLQTYSDLKNFIAELHKQKIKVYFGFWGLTRDQHGHSSIWFESHPEVWAEMYENSDVDPLVMLRKENISLADFIVEQYRKIKNDFDFDGLFLGDGLNGYRYFNDPRMYRDKQSTVPDWTNFYATLARGVHDSGGKLWAYDCLGLPPDQALLHGADYLAQAQAGLDYLVVQTYPTAWGKKWLKKFSGYDFVSAIKTLQATQQLLAKTSCQTFYTLEIGDRVEGWSAKPADTLQQWRRYAAYADGQMLVWANDLLV